MLPMIVYVLPAPVYPLPILYYIVLCKYCIVDSIHEQPDAFLNLIYHIILCLLSGKNVAKFHHNRVSNAVYLQSVFLFIS
jgi:hypothetical protein